MVAWAEGERNEKERKKKKTKRTLMLDEKGETEYHDVCQVRHAQDCKSPTGEPDFSPPKYREKAVVGPELIPIRGFAMLTDKSIITH